MTMPIKLRKNLFEGDHPISQLFGLHPEWYKPFGMLGHNGIDWALPSGTKLYSCIVGKVIENAYDANGYGKYIKIENDDCGVIYAHLRVLSPFKVGSSVSGGDTIGESGNTGNSTGPHLHFGVFPKPRDRSNGYAGYIDPFDSSLVEWVDSFGDNVADDEIEDLKRQLSTMERNKDSWKRKARDRAETIETLKGELEERQAQVERAKDLCGVMEDIKNEAVLKANAYSKQVSVLKGELEIKSEKLRDTYMIIDELEKQIRDDEYTSRDLLAMLLQKISDKIRKVMGE
jgi:hypothetical protein